MSLSYSRFSIVVIANILWSVTSGADCIRTVELPDGRKLGYREFGKPSGHLVFYFHGLPGSHMEASLVEDEIDQAGIRVVSVDRPGIGKSTFQPDRTVLDWPRDIAYLADCLGYRNRKFGIIAASGGTPYACACALKMGHRISHLALVVPFSPSEAEGVERSSQDLLLQFAARHQNLAKLILTAQNKQLERNPDKAAKNGVRPFLPEERAFVLDQPQVKQNFITNLEVIANQGPSGVVTDIVLLANPWGFQICDIRGVDISIWAGGRDKVAPDTMAKYFRCQIPQSRLFVNPDTGHLSTFKQQANRILSRF